MPRKPPKTTPRALKTSRRTPSQERAVQTTDTLFQAAAQILEREGEAALTTNKIASVAGFSIGTLYQYFPSKDALIQAMGLRVQNQVLAQMEKYLHDLQAREDLAQLDPYVLIRQALSLVVKSMTLKGKNKSLLRLYWMLEQPDQTTMATQRMAETLSIFFDQVKHPQIKTPTVTEVFVITRSVLGFVRYASLEKSSLLGSDAVDEVLAQMALGVLQDPAAKNITANTAVANPTGF
jgi:AcrR family transcriptional regulator